MFTNGPFVENQISTDERIKKNSGQEINIYNQITVY